MSKSKKVVENACCVYDFTIFKIIGEQELREILKKHCKKYCFQLEKGEKTGKEHYQGRLSLKEKARMSKVISMFDGLKAHISITSKENRDNNFYVCKEETRVKGPFTDENEVYIPRDVREMTELRPWQNSMKEHLEDYNCRKIDIIIDTKGNTGKTRFTRWMVIYGQAKILPFCNDFKDIMRMGYDVGPQKIYIIDMPRAISKDKLFQFYGAIEALKSGYVYDDRYIFKDRLFDPPRVVVFCNKEPDLTLLTRDMWKLWTIKDLKLVKYIPHEEDPLEGEFYGD